MAERNSASATATKARDRALAKINKKAVLEGDNADKGRECIEIHAVFELYAEEGPDSAAQDLSTHPSLPQMQQLCASLGLSIVGIGISTGSKKKTSDKSLCLWSPNHVYRALQVRNAIISPTSKKNNDSKLFCVLSVAASLDVDENEKEKTRGSNDLKRPLRIDRATRDANPGLVMEAFELSSQALELAKKGILTATWLAPTSSLGTEEAKSERDRLEADVKTRKRAVINKMNMGAVSSSSSSASSSRVKTKGSEADSTSKRSIGPK